MRKLSTEEMETINGGGLLPGIIDNICGGVGGAEVGFDRGYND